MHLEEPFQGILLELSEGFLVLESMLREIRQALFLEEKKKRVRLYDAFLGAIQRQLDRMTE